MYFGFVGQVRTRRALALCQATSLCRQQAQTTLFNDLQSDTPNDMNTRHRPCSQVSRSRELDAHRALMPKMIKHAEWPLFEVTCVLCGHRSCRECREVSTSTLACCRCRERAITVIETFASFFSKTPPGTTTTGPA
jgi:hypothetical protein